MNKKTMKIAGWALGLSLAVAGIGAAVGTSHIVNGNTPTMVKATASPVAYSEVTFSGDLPADGNWTGTGGGSYCGGYGKNKTNAWSVTLDFDKATKINWATVDFSHTVSLNTTVTAAGNSSSGTVTLSINNTASQNVTHSITSDFGNGTSSAAAKAVAMNISSVSSAFSSITLSFPAKSFITKFACTLTFTELEEGTNYTITDSLTNGSLSSTSKVPENTELDITLIPDEHYSLPDELTVTMGGEPLAADEDYLYYSDTGDFYIAAVTGDVVISGACVEDPKYTVTYVADSNGTGSAYAVGDVYVGSYTLLPLATTGLSAKAGYLFSHYEVGGETYAPGAEITISGITTVTAVFESLPRAITIDETTLTKTSSTAGYAGYNGTRAIGGYDILTNQVMIESKLVQFQKTTNAYMYNTTAFASGIRMIKTVGTKTVKVSFDDNTVGSGNGSIGSEVAAITVGEANYYIPTISDAKYFHIVSKNSATDKISSIEVLDGENAAQAFAEMYLAAYSCNASGTAAPTLNSGYTKDLIESLYGAFECSGDSVQALLQNAVKNHSSEYGDDKLAEFGERYYWIVKNHGAANYDFMKLNGTVSFASQNVGFGENTIAQSALPTVITVASIGFAATAGFFLYQRKRKEN